jgi:hypothetical protein
METSEYTKNLIKDILFTIKGFATFIDHTDYPNEPRFSEIVFNDIPFKIVIGLDGFYLNGESFIANKENRFHWHIVRNEKLQGFDKIHFKYNLFTENSFECYKNAIKATIDLYQTELDLYNIALSSLNKTPSLQN